jgi:hypothetical protein
VLVSDSRRGIRDTYKIPTDGSNFQTLSISLCAMLNPMNKAELWYQMELRKAAEYDENSMIHTEFEIKVKWYMCIPTYSQSLTGHR